MNGNSADTETHLASMASVFTRLTVLAAGYCVDTTFQKPVKPFLSAVCLHFKAG